MAKEAAAKPAKREKKQKAGFLKKMTRYFRDLRSEFKKIVWPTKSQVINNTIVVLVMVVVLGIFVAGLDSLLTLVVGLILNQA